MGPCSRLVATGGSQRRHTVKGTLAWSISVVHSAMIRLTARCAHSAAIKDRVDECSWRPLGVDAPYQ